MISGPRLLGLSPPAFETGCIGFQMSFLYSGCWVMKDPCDQGGNAYLLLAVLAVLHSLNIVTPI